MFLNYNIYWPIFFKFYNIILNCINLNLLKLNNIKLNYLILVITLTTMFYFYYKIINYIIMVVLTFFINKFYFFFIKKFYFGYFKIHPFIFYGTLLIYMFNQYKNIVYLKLKNKYLMYAIITSFVFGGYWNIFHLNEGLFWSNDSIEFLLIIYIYISLEKIHKFNKVSMFKFQNVFIFIILLIFIRFNFIYTKHNFFSLIKKKFKIYILFYSLIVLNYLMQVNIIKKKLLIINKIIKYLLNTYLCLIICFNYLNFFILKSINTFIIFYLYLFFLVYNKWTNYKYIFIHLILTLLIALYNVFYLKYVLLLDLKYNKVFTLYKWTDSIKFYLIKNYNYININFPYYYIKKNNIITLINKFIYLIN